MAEKKGFSTRLTGIPKSRIIFLASFFVFFVFAYSFYLYSLQVVNVGEYQRRATAVSRRLERIPSQRGEIYDRHFDVPLVLNIPSFAVDIVPADLPAGQREDVYQRLAEILNISVQEIRNKIPPRYYHLYEPLEIKDSVEFETIIYLAENKNDFPGVSWHDKPIRSYLETGSISHILGYVGNITTEELQIYFNQGYQRNSIIGKAGIEKQYDLSLMGQEGLRFHTVDVRGRYVKSSGSTADKLPQNGKKMVLTIDRRLQTLAEKALGERTGSVVILKPSTGEVLAMVSYPWYDPNLFYTDSRNQYFQQLSLDPKFPFINRTIQSAFAPASTFKILMAAAVIEEEVFPLNQKVTCEGSKRYGDRVFHCHNRNGHGSLNLEEAVAQSCNIYFYTMGHEYLGIERIAEYARMFGLGERSGIDLAGEIRGIVPNPEWKEKTYNSRWVGGDTLNTSIGQGYLNVTPLQAANLVAMIVNEGVIYKPHILKEVRDPLTGVILEEVQPEVLKEAGIRKETFQLTKDYMRDTITNGTARWVITTNAVEVAAKTGTGEVGLEDQWSSWFVSFAPYKTDNPDEQVVVVVHIDGQNTWEWWAPKAADIIYQGIFANQTFEEVMEEFKNRWYIRELRERERLAREGLENAP